MIKCKENDTQDGQLEKNKNKVEENVNVENINSDKITEAYTKYCSKNNFTLLNFSPCEDLKHFFEKSGMGDISKISITDVNVCEILNTEDIVMHVYIENKLYSYTYIIPFIYSDNAFQLNEEAIITFSELLNYTLIDVDGDNQNEIIAEYILTHNGTDHVIQILKCDSSNEGREIFYKSVDEHTHKLDYRFSDEIPKKFWVQDTKTYINQKRKKKVAKKINYLYVLKEGKYQIEKKKIERKSDMSDFYQWTLG